MVDLKSSDQTYIKQNKKDSTKKEETLIRRNSHSDSNKIIGYDLEPQQAFGMQNTYFEKNIEFVGNDEIIFSSGCNLVLYSLETRNCEFIMRKYPKFRITSLSVGYKDNDDPLIVLGEALPDNSSIQISVIAHKNQKSYHVLNQHKVETKGWTVKKALILKGSPYCLGILSRAQEEASTKIMFWKYTQEKFISEVELNQVIYDVSYNPKNCLELILCGKGFLRLWNVFINDGSLKEHPQRFLKGKQEKEKTFLKAAFFSNKSFMFIVITKENNLYVFEGFKQIFTLGISFEKGKFDMNIDKILSSSEEDIEDGNNFTSGQENTNEERHSKKQSKEEKQENLLLYSQINQINPIKTFFLLSNQNIILTSTFQSITFQYKIDKEMKKNTFDRKEPFLTDEHEKLRIARNIKSILNMICNNKGNQVLYMCELEPDFGESNRVSFYLFERTSNELKFSREIFKEFYYNDKNKSFDYCEKKKMLYSITHNGWLRCYDNNSFNFYTKNKFDEVPTAVTASPNNNLFGICFKNKFTLFALLKDNIQKFCEFDINNSVARYSIKGNLIAVGGNSRVNPSNYCIYFVDSFYFQTVHVIDYLPQPIKKILWFDNDRYILVMLENSHIYGWMIDFEYLTVNLYLKLKEFDSKPITSYFFKGFFRHVSINSYNDFDYDTKNDYLVTCYTDKTDVNKLSIFSKSEKSAIATYNTDVKTSCLKIILNSNLQCLLIGTEIGSIRIYTWPFDFKREIDISGVQILEKFLHSSQITNLYLTSNLKQIISTSEDGSIYVCKIKIIREDSIQDFDFFFREGHNMKPPLEQSIKFSEINEYSSDLILKKDKIAEDLNVQIEELVKTMENTISEMKKKHNNDILFLESQKNDSLTDEQKKFDSIEKEIDQMNQTVEEELKNKVQEHKKNKEITKKKNEEKLKIYTNEIARLKKELISLNEEINENFNKILDEENQSYKNESDKGDKEFKEFRDKINDAIKKLTIANCSQDEAIATMKEDYETNIGQIKSKFENDIKNYQILIGNKDLSKDEKIESNEIGLKSLQEIAVQENQNPDYNFNKDTWIQENTKRIQEKKPIKSLNDILADRKKIEENNNFETETWIVESNKIIQRNIHIKQNLNDTTQKIITLQEQLLETEKNLRKIDREIENLTTKNKHLEQIRFVLENRTTSLEKEKAPLEDQCLFLEKQKNSLQDEFSKLVLQISLMNQELENKQSQLKACLMQNFEIDEQIKYIKSKMTFIQNELKNFILINKKENDSKKPQIQKNKPSQICLALKAFYDKYFDKSIDIELTNFQYYFQKLQEISEKANASSNYDLIKRDKATEKLYSEEDKLDQLKKQKNEVFRRMQKENTTLIAECNRLRKNLHEVFMHVVEIEKKFQELTKISKDLKKDQLVVQIKKFIKEFYKKIKSNYMKGDEEEDREEEEEEEEEKGSDESMKDDNDESTLKNKKMFKAMEDNQNVLYEQNRNLEKIKTQIQNVMGNNKTVDTKNDYENFHKLPEITSKSANFGTFSVATNVKKVEYNLPNIVDKK